MEATLNTLTTVLAWVFAWAIWLQYRERGKLHQLLWAAGLAGFAFAITLETVVAAQGQWGELAYRLWYFFGAMHGVTLLGQGTLHLLYRAPWAQRSLELLVVVALAGLAMVLNAPLDFSALPTPHAATGLAFRTVAEAGWATPRAWTIPFNVYGTLWLVGGAMYSSAQLWNTQRLRATGTLLIAVGGLGIGAASSLNRFAVVGLESLGVLLGLTLMFFGFLLTNLDATLLEKLNLPRPSLPRIAPMVLVAALGWAVALVLFFALEPGAWVALRDYPGLFLIGLLIVALVFLVINKARTRMGSS